MDTSGITFASLLQPTGVVVAAAIITTLVQLIKSVLPTIDAKVSGALMAFVLSAILYILAGISTSVATLDAGLLIFTAWLSCATSAVGIKSAADHVVAVQSQPPDAGG